MRFLSTFAVLALASMNTSLLTHAQVNPDQELRAGLLDLKNSGPEGSLKAAKMFAQCHGFQSALYANLTIKISIRTEDSDFAIQIGEQAMTDGHMAFLSSVVHTPNPEAYVNNISEAERTHWKEIINKPGKKDPVVWEKLFLCQKIAPMSQYFVEEIRRKERSVISD